MLTDALLILAGGAGVGGLLCGVSAGPASVCWNGLSEECNACLCW